MTSSSRPWAQARTRPWTRPRARITVEGGGDVSETLVKDLVIDSYRLVVRGLRKAERPVDPRTYGRSA